MPTVSKEQRDPPRGPRPVEEWSQDVGGWNIEFVRFGVDIDATPLLKGLPDDRCPCPHWGYVLSGRVVFTFAGHEEAHEAKAGRFGTSGAPSSVLRTADSVRLGRIAFDAAPGRLQPQSPL